MENSKIYHSHRNGCTESDEMSLSSHALSLPLLLLELCNCWDTSSSCRTLQELLPLIPAGNWPTIANSPLRPLCSLRETSLPSKCAIYSRLRFNIACETQQKALPRINKLLTPFPFFFA